MPVSHCRWCLNVHTFQFQLVVHVEFHVPAAKGWSRLTLLVTLECSSRPNDVSSDLYRPCVVGHFSLSWSTGGSTQPSAGTSVCCVQIQTATNTKFGGDVLGCPSPYRKTWCCSEKPQYIPPSLLLLVKQAVSQ